MSNKKSSSEVFKEAILTPYVNLEHGMMSMDTRVRGIQLFLDQSECRDKMFKVLQYAIKAFLIYVKQNKQTFVTPTWQDRIPRLKHLMDTTSTARKFLKLFCFVPFIRLAIRVARYGDHGWLQYCFVGRMLGLSGYMFFDNLIWAVKMKLYDGSTHKLKWYSLSCLLGYIFSSIIVNSYTMGVIAAEVKLISSYVRKIEGKNIVGKEITLHDREVIKTRLKVLQNKKWDLKCGLLRNSLEWTLACNFVFGLGISEGLLTVLDVTMASAGTLNIYQRMLHKASEERKFNTQRKDQIKRTSMLVRTNRGRGGSFN